MTLADRTYPRGFARLAGQAASWGASVSVLAGVGLPDAVELLRASVGYPVVWQWAVWLDGGPTGVLAGGAPPGFVRVFASPGLGKGGSLLGQRFIVGEDPIPSSIGGLPGGTPATELVIKVQVPAVDVIGDFTLCGVACPVFYDVARGAQG